MFAPSKENTKEKLIRNDNSPTPIFIMIDKILESYQEETFLKADGFDEAIIGVEESGMRLIYSTAKCIDILMKDMSEEEALEYFEFNLSGSYMGDKTPIWCSDYFPE